MIYHLSISRLMEKYFRKVYIPFRKYKILSKELASVYLRLSPFVKEEIM